MNVDVTIKRKAPIDQYKTLVVKVSDTGRGIPPNQLLFIFDRFYKTDKIKTFATTNSGIGLSLTKSLVDFLCGNINVESTLNHGSTFTVELPLNLKPNQEVVTNDNDLYSENKINFEIEPNDKALELKEINTEKRQNRNDLKTLLIVEDNKDMQIFLNQSFQDNYNIIQAYDGTSGYELACKNIPDIIISDIMMPKMDGVELCNMLKNSHITNHIPIILLTARSAVEHKIVGLEIGADAYISKPFHFKHLEAQIKNLLKQRELLRKMYADNVGQAFYSQTPKIINADKEFLERAEKIIEDNLVNLQFDVEQFSNELNLSQMQLYRKLKSICGSSINEFIRNYRLKKAAILLIESNLNITQVLYEVGFSSRSYFTKSFRDHFNLTPREYIKKHKT